MVPALQFGQRFIPVAPPHARLNKLGKSAPRLNRRGECVAPVGAVGEYGAGIVRQGAMPARPS
jgi:hypothetical protein